MCFEHLETEIWLLFEDGYKLGYAKDTVLLLTISCLVVFFHLSALSSIEGRNCFLSDNAVHVQKRF